MRHFLIIFLMVLSPFTIFATEESKTSVKENVGAKYGYDRDKEFLGSPTPVKGLYLASAWSNGGGYTSVMMAVRNAVRHLLKDFKILSKV